MIFVRDHQVVILDSSEILVTPQESRIGVFNSLKEHNSFISLNWNPTVYARQIDSKTKSLEYVFHP